MIVMNHQSTIDNTISKQQQSNNRQQATTVSKQQQSAIIKYIPILAIINTNNPQYII